MEFEERRAAPWRWPLLLSIVLLNICLPSLVLAYGTLLVHALDVGVSTQNGLATPTIFLLTYCLSHCWCRDAADSWGGSVGYRLLASLGLLLIVTSLVLCAFVPFHLQPYIYGVLGGLGASLTAAQVDAVVFDTYDNRLQIVRGLSSLGQAIGQSLFPHIVSSLVNYYGYSMSFIVLSAIALQMLPAILFLKISDTVKRPISNSRYSDVAKSYAIFNNETVKNFYTNELQLNELSKSWKSPDSTSTEGELDFYDIDGQSVNICTITPPPSPEEKRRNIFGVEILPEIREESEISDEEELNDDEISRNRQRCSTAIQRLSVMGDDFDEYIDKQIRKDSAPDHQSKQYTELDVRYETMASLTEIKRAKVFNSFSFRCRSAYASMRRKLWMPSYRAYRIKRRLLYTVYVINDTFMKPLTRSLSCWRFYPTLLLGFSKLILIAISLTLLPLINLGIEPKISMTETNFMISLHGFAWTCFLLITPWLAQTPKRNFKYIVLLGLIFSGSACYVIAISNSHDSFSIGCVVAGLGFGAISSCWDVAAKEFVGAHKWSKIHSTLDTLAGISLAAFVFGLSFLIQLDEPGSFNLYMLVIGSILIIVAAVWFVIGLVSLYMSKVRTLR